MPAIIRLILPQAEKISVSTSADFSLLSVAEWRNLLSGIAGLDIECGLALVRGNTAKHARLLKIFIDTHGGDVARLYDAQQAGDLATLVDLAHTLKGAASTIGATGVAATSIELHARLRHQAPSGDVAAGCKALEAELSNFIEATRRLFS